MCPAAPASTARRPSSTTARAACSTAGQPASSTAGSRLPCNALPGPTRRGGIGQRGPPVDADDRRAGRSDIAPSSSAVPTPKCVIGTPWSASAANTRALCGST